MISYSCVVSWFWLGFVLKGIQSGCCRLMFRSARKARIRLEAENQAAAGATNNVAATTQPAPSFRVQCNEGDVATIFTPMKITLTNLSDDVFLYKLQTNVPQRYRVSPEPFGVLTAKEVVTVEIHVTVEEDTTNATQQNKSDSMIRARSPDRSSARSSSFKANDGQATNKARTRSASSGSLAGLLRYRPKESLDDIRAESLASIAEIRTTKRSSYLSRRSFESSKDDHLSTRRILRMSFAPDEEHIPEIVVEDATSEATPAAPTTSSSTVAMFTDMIRIESRMLPDCDVNDVKLIASLSTSRDEHRARWAMLALGGVEVVPIRSEPVKRSQLDGLISSTEPVGVQLLREDRNALQARVSALQAEHAVICRTNESKQWQLQGAADSLQNELGSSNSSLFEINQQLLSFETIIVVNSETDQRSMIEQCSSTELLPMILQWIEQHKEIVAATDVVSAIKHKELEELTARFGNNPFPEDRFLLFDIASIVIPTWVGWLAICAAIWSCVVRLHWFPSS